ncbi:Dps family protein [Erythrobacter litoralis]|uniref:Hypothetical low temperature-induced protein n=1 Tax=Erythrobacter litoralis (strain HTCC2594) TaxID=314225 RepID=Q2N8B3_ERYLH|nr:DNA starvation/stationary phase protection protein [Erythrobacter litoralis]ABC64078.1 hypothetical low temperature-induced protein [Erythrobacter litoralis HTCC2594]
MSTQGDNSKAALVSELNGLLADHFALYTKAKNFHWHVKGSRFRDLHLLFDEQAVEVRDRIDMIGERVRKNDATTLTSIGSVAANTRIKDQDATDLSADAMVQELHDDNVKVLERLKKLKGLAEDAGDNATDGILDDLTDETEERIWFLKSTLG